MPYQTHDTPELRVPSFFWHLLRYPRVVGIPTPWIERTVTNEVEAPYREGHAVALRLGPLRHALVIGWWSASQPGALQSESEGLAGALGGEVMLGVPVTQMAEWRRPEIEEELPDLPEGITMEDHR